jgi:hypothetical protein
MRVVGLRLVIQELRETLGGIGVVAVAVAVGHRLAGAAVGGMLRVAWR